MAMEVDVAIVGEGLGGLALALGLQERGIRAHDFEKALNVRPHSGTAISLALNGLRVLDGLKPGLSARLMTHGTAMKQVTGKNRVDSQPEKETRSAYPPGALYVIAWKRAQQTLADAIVDQSLLHWRHTFLDYNIVEGDRVEARFEVPALEESPARHHLFTPSVDGMRSQVRKRMVGDEPRDLHLITWNALVPTKNVSSLNLHGESELNFFSYRNADTYKSVYLFDAGCGLTLWQVRALDASGEMQKVRALRQAEGLQWVANLSVAIEGTDPDAIREARACDQLPLASWSDSSKRVVHLGDGKVDIPIPVHLTFHLSN